MTPGADGAPLEERDAGELEAELRRLEQEAEPLRAHVEALRGQADVIRTELRRRSRQDQLRGRQAVRAELAAGGMPTLEALVSGEAEAPGARSISLDDLRFIRDSATEVRLGYASASKQSLSFTDGVESRDATDLGAARELWRLGWEFGTPLARGVRIYPVGSRAERMVPAAEVHVEVPKDGGPG